MKRTRISRRTFLGSAAAVGGAAYIGEARAATVLRMSHDTTNASPKNFVSIKAAERIKKRTDGRVSIEVFERGELVKGLEEAQSIRQGIIDMAASPSAQLPGTSKNLAALQLPMWGAATSAQKSRVYDQGIGWTSIRDDIERSLQVKILGVGWSAPLSYFFVKKEVRSPADFAGLKIRVPGAVWDQYTKALGGVPVQMNLGELYTSLQNGTLDGVDTSAEAMVAFRGEQVLKHCLYSNHASVPYIFMISQRSLAKLSPGDQKILSEEFSEAVREERIISERANDEPMRKIRAAGVKVEDDPKVVRSILDHLVKNQDKLIEHYKLDADLVSQIQKALT